MPSTTHRSKRPPSTAVEDLDDVMTPEMDDEEAALARPIREAPASLLAALPKNLPKTKGGRPRVASPKAHVSLRVDADVLAAYKATGAGWQVRMNEALKCGVAQLERA